MTSKAKSEFSVRDKTFLITGAASGLGAGFAERFLKDGAKHVAILDIAAEAGESTAKKLRTEYGDDSVSFIKCDISNETLLKDTFKNLVEDHQTIDVVINNAGILNDSPGVYRKAIDVNWQGLVTLSLLAFEHMKKENGGAGGTIVNISSIAALGIWPFLPIYSATKSAVLHFSCCLGMEPNYVRTGVRVVCIAFGPTYTPLMDDISSKCIDETMGIGFVKREEGQTYQSVEGAVNALATVVKQGKTGSVWVAVQDKPVKDITDSIRAGYMEIAKTGIFSSYPPLNV